jgi:hypothetical protein
MNCTLSAVMEGRSSGDNLKKWLILESAAFNPENHLIITY